MITGLSKSNGGMCGRDVSLRTLTAKPFPRCPEQCLFAEVPSSCSFQAHVHECKLQSFATAPNSTIAISTSTIGGGMGLDERENPGGTIASFVDEVELAGNRDGARATGFCSLLRSTAAEIRRRRSERRHRQRRSLPRID